MTKAELLAKALPQGIDGALITSENNRRYLTGFPSSAGMVLVTLNAAYFLTDFRYIEAARRKIQGMECIEYKKISETLCGMISRHGLMRLAVEDEGLTCAEFKRIGKMLPDTELCGGILDGLLGELRLTKSPEELDKIKQSQELTDYGFEYILPFIKAGRTEKEVALEMEFAMRKKGAECVAFDFIVVSGANSSLPHGVPSDKVIERGDFVTMDFGAVIDGWHSDMTRTIAVGECSEEQRQVYQTVLQAQKATLGVLRAGYSCVKGDAAARNVISEAGYGDCFGHGTGHGVGIEIHEAPFLSPSAGDASLRAGSIVTVEPGIYLPGKFGVRIEDMAYITRDGCEDLTKSPKELIIN